MRKNPFRYVPPGERSGCLRVSGFAAAIILVLGGIAAFALAAFGPGGPLTVFVLFRVVPLALFGGAALWLWLREDPRRR
jgi:hypothetical protein